jgi:Raf kinase inhibitor-like YbhB/YbcL family protein
MIAKIASLAACVAVCGSAAAAAPFSISSTSFKDGQVLDRKHAGNLPNNPNCVGDNVSPQFSWTNVPEGTKSFAMIMLDPEGRAPAGVVHWIGYGIPATVTSFAEGDLEKQSERFVGGKSTLGVGTYVGPCTPPGIGFHHYTFVLMATDLEPGALQPGMTREEFTSAVQGHVKGSTGIVVLYGQP